MHTVVQKLSFLVLLSLMSAGMRRRLQCWLVRGMPAARREVHLVVADLAPASVLDRICVQNISKRHQLLGRFTVLYSFSQLSYAYGFAGKGSHVMRICTNIFERGGWTSDLEAIARLRS